MALVLFLRGVNVGGHKTFRPTVLAKELSDFGLINIGAAGTFVVRGRAGQAELRRAVERRLPFAAEVIICQGSEILRLTAGDPFAGHRTGPDIVPFASVLARRAKPSSPLPLQIPADGEWGVRVLRQDGRLVCGMYRRQMKAIAYLGQLDRLFGVPATTRNWNTMQMIARALVQH